LKQRLFNEELLNIFFYGNDDSDGSAADLAAGFSVEAELYLAQIQVEALTYEGVEVTNLFDDGDFAILDDMEAGLVSGQAYPSTVAVNFTLRPSSRAVRPGSKRFGGIGETAGDGNEITDSGYAAALENVRTFLEATINGTGGLDADYVPVVVKRIKEGVDPDFTYRLPENGSEANVYPVAGVLFNGRFSHQTTRGN
jgi:hypothetical protein